MTTTREFIVHPAVAAAANRRFWAQVPSIPVTPDSVNRFTDGIPASIDRLDSIDRRDLADHLGLDSRDSVWGDE